MLFEQCNDRLFQLLSYIGYCIEFPRTLAARIGGHPDWTRHVMYRAIKEEYVSVYRKETSRKVVSSLRITEKGLDYVAEKSPEVFMLIQARLDGTPQGSHSSKEKVLRYHSFATAMVMAHNAGAVILPPDKPSLMLRERRIHPQLIDPNRCYFYSTTEIRNALEEYAEDIQVKGSRLAGVIVHGTDCFLIYDSGRSRMFWMRSTEENFAASIETLLNHRGFEVNVLRQVIIGFNMGVAEKLCRRKVYKGTRYFVLSDFFNNCFFLTNNADGDFQLKALLHPEIVRLINSAALKGCRIPKTPSRDYDAVDIAEGRPVILNYECDLLTLADLSLAPDGFRYAPIILCFDHQVETMQRVVGVLAEVRGIGSVKNYG